MAPQAGQYSPPSVVNDSTNQWMKIADLSNMIFKFCVEEKPSQEAASQLQRFAQTLYSEAETMKNNLCHNDFSYDQNLPHYPSNSSGFMDAVAEPTYSMGGTVMAGPYCSTPQTLYPMNPPPIHYPQPPNCISNVGQKRPRFSVAPLMETPSQAPSTPFSYFEINRPESQTKEQEFPPPAKRKRRKAITTDRVCKICGDTQTPEWRKGPQGSHTLCNACGLNYAKKVKQERQNLERQGRRKQSIDVIIDNCKHQFTTIIQSERIKRKPDNVLKNEETTTTPPDTTIENEATKICEPSIPCEAQTAVIF